MQREHALPSAYVLNSILGALGLGLLELRIIDAGFDLEVCLGIIVSGFGFDLCPPDLGIGLLSVP